MSLSQISDHKTPPLDGRSRKKRNGEPHDLSPRQLQIAEALARQESNRTIASALGISERTVEVHVAKIYAIMRVHNRAAASTACRDYLAERRFQAAAKIIATDGDLYGGA